MGHQELAEIILEGEEESRKHEAREGEDHPSARRLFRHWRLAIVAILFIWSVSEVYEGFAHRGLDIGTNWLTTLIFFLPLIAIVFLWAQESFSDVSILKDVRAVDKILNQHSGRLGRDTDIQQIMSICASGAVIHLTGESGVGKTSLLQFGLAEQLRATKKCRPIYIDSLGNDWDASEDPATRQVIAASCPTIADISTRAMATTIIESLPSGEGFPLLIFDEFNAYLTRHRQKLINSVDGSWIPNSELCANNHFWKRIFELVRKREIAVIFVARTDESDGLHPFTTSAVVVRRLAKLESQLIMSIAREIDACVAKPNAGWKLFSKKLVEDLDHDGGYILPIEATLVFTALKTMRALTVREYVRLGRVEGLIGRRISCDVQESAAPDLRTGDVIMALATMFDKANFQILGRTLDDMVATLKAQSIVVQPNAMERCLQLLAGRRITRLSYRSDSTESVWMIYHSYIARAIARLVYARQTANERLQLAYDEYKAAPFRSRWGKLLAPYALVQTLALAVFGRLNIRNKLDFLAASALRLAPYVLLLFSPLVLADSGVQMPGGDTARRWIDSRGISVFRRAHSPGVILNEARKEAARMRNMIDLRQSSDGWIMAQTAQDSVPDLWSHAQATYAELIDQPDGKTEEAAFKSLGLMFTPEWEVTNGNRCFGWSQRWYAHPTPEQKTEMVTESYPRAEILFWTAASVFKLRPHVLVSEQTVIDSWTNYLEKSMGGYWGAGAESNPGAWNRYMDQSTGASDHSVYVTALALTALLNARESNIPLKVDNLDRDELIRQSCNWLWSAHTTHNGLVGWSDENRLDIVPLEGLSYQTYSVLLRAGRMGIWECPDELIDDCIKYVDLVYGEPLPEETMSRRLQAFQNSFGHPKFIEYPLTFLTYPWLLECTASLLENHPSGAKLRSLSDSERRLLTSILSSMVVDQAPAQLKTLLDADPYTYRPAEALLAFGRVKRVLATADQSSSTQPDTPNVGN